MRFLTFDAAADEGQPKCDVLRAASFHLLHFAFAHPREDDFDLPIEKGMQ